MRFGAVTLATSMFLVLASVVSATEVVIPDVPSYIWYRGCGPTAGGMVIGYWDGQGYEGLIPGTNDWYTNPQAVKDMIASPGHVRDYVPTPDRVPTESDPLHADDSVADFNRCSRDPNEYGYSLFSKQDDGMADYAVYRGYDLAVGSTHTYLNDSFWTSFVAEIDAGRPVELLVDTEGDGLTDHYVTAFGYDDTKNAERYAFYDTWSHVVHWSSFRRVGVGVAYGIWGGSFFDPGAPIGDANGDQLVDGYDLSLWQQNYDPLAQNANTFSTADWNVDGCVDGTDLALWQAAYDSVASSGTPVASVPEPGSLSLLGFVFLGVIGRARRLARR